MTVFILILAKSVVKIVLEKISKDSIYILGESAFEYCEKLENDIEIIEGTVEVKNNVFAGCTNIKKIYIPDSLEEVGGGSFMDVGTLIFKQNAEMYLELKSEGYQCIMTDYSGRKKVEKLERDENKKKAFQSGYPLFRKNHLLLRNNGFTEFIPMMKPTRKCWNWRLLESFPGGRKNRASVGALAVVAMVGAGGEKVFDMKRVTKPLWY